jgi:hypothetical protein
LDRVLAIQNPKKSRVNLIKFSQEELV